MPDVVVIEFDAPDAIEIYRSVSRVLGVDPSTGAGDWPAPLHSHIAAASDDKLIVVEVWESQAVQAAFMESQLAPAFHKANVSPPSRVAWYTLAGEMHRS